ncbi:DUF397 domain-containing protein [Streptomyces sp. NPDC029674]|uniref:DUF397 domain-containing protein n=1 Tax=Streptomyces sp. NPDC029674 TaxID=3365297 RepID=UPI00384D0D9B
MPELHWLKSSFSGDGGNNCIEVAVADVAAVVLRESDSPADVLSTAPAALGALIRGVKAGPLTPPVRT